MTRFPKRLKWILFFSFNLLLFCSEAREPILDLHAHPPKVDKRKALHPFACRAFNGSPEIAYHIADLVKTYSINTAFETGTRFGTTSRFFSYICKEVYTVEMLPSLYATVKKNLRPYKNVHCLLGDSAKVLPLWLPKLKNKRVLFYLDAH